MTKCGHRTNRASGICKACVSLWQAGIIPLYDGWYDVWRKHERKTYEPKKEKICPGPNCGTPISKKSTYCQRCYVSNQATLRNKARAEQFTEQFTERNNAICEYVNNADNKARACREMAKEYKLSVTRIRNIAL